MNVSEVMVQYLKAAGIGHLFGYPGDPNVEFLEALRQLLAGARPTDRPLVVGARIDPAQYTAQF